MKKTKITKILKMRNLKHQKQKNNFHFPIFANFEI